MVEKELVNIDKIKEAPKVLNSPFVVSWQMEVLQENMGITKRPKKEDIDKRLADNNDILMKVQYSYVICYMGIMLTQTKKALESSGRNCTDAVGAFYRVSQHPAVKALTSLPKPNVTLTPYFYFPMIEALEEAIIRCSAQLHLLSEGTSTASKIASLERSLADPDVS